MEINDISNAELNNLLNFISIEKSKKINKFYKKDDKLRSLFGELLLRYALCNTLNCNNESIKFYIDKYGKPYLKDICKCNFNLSHSGDYVAVIISNNQCGIDIEKVNPIDYIDIVKVCYTPEEYNYVVNCDEKERIHRFYEVWTLKESRVKCSGQGLSLPLKSFSMNIANLYKISSKESYTGIKEPYLYTLKDINGEYKLSLCSKYERCCSSPIPIEQKNIIHYFDQ